MVKRLKNHINYAALIKIADSIFNSKLRYGLQLLRKIRWSASDTQYGDLLSLQKVQNKLARFLNNKRISDKISIKSLMANIGFLSVNQIYKAKIAIIKYCLTLPI